MDTKGNIAIGIIGDLATHQNVFIGMVAYAFKYGWTYRYFTLSYLTFSLAITGALIFAIKIIKSKKFNKQIFILPGWNFALLSLLYALFWILTVSSLFEVGMTSTRYILLSIPIDYFLYGLFSTFMLKRSFGAFYWSSTLLSLFSYFLFDFLQFEGGNQFTWSFGPPKVSWYGPVFCIFARILNMLDGALSKRYLITAGYEAKMKKKLKEVINYIGKRNEKKWNKCRSQLQIVCNIMQH